MSGYHDDRSLLRNEDICCRSLSSIMSVGKLSRKSSSSSSSSDIIHTAHGDDAQVARWPRFETACSACSLTGLFGGDVEWARRGLCNALDRLPQLPVLLALLLGAVLLLHLPVLQLVVQLQVARLQQPPERRAALLGARLQPDTKERWRQGTKRQTASITFVDQEQMANIFCKL